MASLVVLGAGGFLGRAVLAQSRDAFATKAVARAIPSGSDDVGGVTWHSADILAQGSLDSILEHGDTVINLAYTAVGSTDENLRLIDNVIDSCVRRRVARLLHCSTAIVVGAARASRVTEMTQPVPRTSYERTKLAVESRASLGQSRGLDVGIVRPTAIVGPGGQNLVKLAESLRSGSRVVGYLRSSLFGRRPMHLVSVRTVAAAVIHLAMLPRELAGQVYIVSSDHDPNNNFRDVEVLLRRSLGVPPRTLPPLPVPTRLLSFFLKIRQRSETDVDREFVSDRLFATNFTPVESVAEAVAAFAADLRTPLA